MFCIFGVWGGYACNGSGWEGPEEDIGARAPGTGIIIGCELASMGVRNRIWILWKYYTWFTTEPFLRLFSVFDAS